MTRHVTGHRSGFGAGWTHITRYDEADDNTGIAMSVLKLDAGGAWEEKAPSETAFLLMDGAASIVVGNQTHELSRHSLFDQSPSALHVAAGEAVRIQAARAAEFTVYRTANRKTFRPTVYRPEDVEDERRGKGQVGDTCLRLVRTIFDRRNSDANAELVLGEVVTLPGRWSSYPPHHHAQPEIYHYRFTKPQGYGHAELGDTVLKVRQNDTVKILADLDHAQCAAPGYGMYYAWVIRHLPDRPYTVPEFTPEHRWVMEPGSDHWRPAGIKDYG